MTWGTRPGKGIGNPTPPGTLKLDYGAARNLAGLQSVAGFVDVVQPVAAGGNFPSWYHLKNIAKSLSG